MTALTFRVFVSSTFTDFEHERRALRMSVFPALEELCRARGHAFQCVDLRWGVGAAAAQAQRTMSICFEEIARAQALSPRPNFIALLGERYGWRPLPDVIAAEHFERIAGHLADPSDAEFLRSWYPADENAVPAEHVLRPRTGGEIAPASWEGIEARLRDLLDRSGAGISARGEIAQRYGRSATALELERGLFAVADQQAHALVIGRELANRDEVVSALPADWAKACLDTTLRGEEDLAAREQQLALRQRAEEMFPEHFVRLQANVRSTGPDSEYLRRFVDVVRGKLERVLVEQMDAVEPANTNSVALQRVASDREFVSDRARVFVGRSAQLQTIRRYVQGSSDRPLLVHGKPGSGKSALLARALDEMERDESGALVLGRFIGITPETSDAHALESGLTAELLAHARARGLEVPASTAGQEVSLARALRIIAAKAKVVLFLDGIDQLRGGAEFAALLFAAPKTVRIVVSAASDSAAFERLSRGLPEAAIVQVGGLTRDEGAQLVQQWLATVNRALTRAQSDVLLDAFAADGAPLYLRIALEEARRWRSHDKEAGANLPKDVTGVLARMFERLAEPSAHGPLLVRRALALIASARYGMADDEMLDLLSEDARVYGEFRAQSARSDAPPDGRLPDLAWYRLLYDLKPFVADVSVGAARVHAFLHRSFRDFAQRYFGEGAEDSRTLASYFERRWRSSDVHALAELPYQHVSGGAPESAERLLLDADWISTKLAATNVDWLLADYELVGDQPAAAVASVRNALKLCARVLAERPEEYAAQLVGRLLGEDAPTADLMSRLIVTAPKPWLRPMRPALHAPTGPIIGRMQVAGGVSALRVAPDGTLLSGVYGDQGNAITVWDPKTQLPVRVSDAGVGSVRSIAIALDGSTWASASGDHTVKVWDGPSGTLRASLTGHTGRVLDVDIDAAGELIASSGRDGTVRLWSLRRHELLATMECEEREVAAVRFSHDGRVLSAGQDGKLIAWDPQTGRGRELAAADAELTALSLARSGQSVIYGDYDGTVWTLSLQPGSEPVRIAKLHGTIRAIVEVGRGLIAVALDGRVIEIVDLQARAHVTSLAGHEGAVATLEVLADGQRFVSGGSEDGLILLWDVAAACRPRPRIDHAMAVGAVGFSADGDAVISMSSDAVVVRSLSDGTERRMLEGRNFTKGALSACARGAVLANVMETQVYRMPDGVLLGAFASDGARPQAVVPSASYVLESTHEHLTFRHIPDGKVLWTTPARGAEELSAVTANADGSRAIACYTDGEVRIWDVSARKLLRSFRAHEARIRQVACASGRACFATGDEGGRISIWSLEGSGEKISLDGHTAPITSLAFDGEGQLLVSAAEDRTLVVWALSGASPSARFTGDGWFNAVAFAPDGRRVLAGDRLGNVHSFALEPLADVRAGKRLADIRKPSWIRSERSEARNDEGPLRLGPKVDLAELARAARNALAQVENAGPSEAIAAVELLGSVSAGIRTLLDATRKEKFEHQRRRIEVPQSLRLREEALAQLLKTLEVA